MNELTDNEFRAHRIWAIAAAVVVMTVASAGTYGCVQSYTVYRELAGKCIEHGGTWLESGSSSQNGTCIYPTK